MIYYRGTHSATKPKLCAGNWLTNDADVACWYGAAHRYELPDNLKVLDLSDYGVELSLKVANVVATACDVDPYDLTQEQEIHAAVEKPSVLDGAELNGYDAIRVMQWNADYSDDPYESLILTNDEAA